MASFSPTQQAMATPVSRSAETPAVADPADWLFRSPLASPQADGVGVTQRRTPPGTLLAVIYALPSAITAAAAVPAPACFAACQYDRPAAVHEAHWEHYVELQVMLCDQDVMEMRLLKTLRRKYQVKPPSSGRLIKLLPLSSAGPASRKARAWDRGDLLRRLHSFRPTTWFLKPPGADPVTCARHGWVNAGTDLLACEVGSMSCWTITDPLGCWTPS
jgi:hypothetical protein